jgi:ubiquinone/menaquinone biosynthesis C-methylase UbiE
MALEGSSVSIASREPRGSLFAPGGSPQPRCNRMTDCIHGYGDSERARLVAQAEHWRFGLINDGTTTIEAGTRLLEVGCGTGAVLAVLGEEFPGARLHGVDIDANQLESARAYLTTAGIEADLTEADAHALPFPDAAFDHVWMMWVLEHLRDPVTALREARRVLQEDGQITAIEVDYATCTCRPSTHAIKLLFDAMVAAWRAPATATPARVCRAGWPRPDTATSVPANDPSGGRGPI